MRSEKNGGGATSLLRSEYESCAWRSGSADVQKTCPLLTVPDLEESGHLAPPVMRPFDRLAAIETSLRKMASREVCTEEDGATVRRAMANLRSSVASWKTGTLANAGRYLGLRWMEGRGLTTGAPYLRGKHGWEARAVPVPHDRHASRDRPNPNRE